jgi:hypothetical protein
VPFDAAIIRPRLFQRTLEGVTTSIKQTRGYIRDVFKV